MTPLALDTNALFVSYGAPARVKLATGGSRSDTARAQAQDFETVFVNAMLQHMFTGIAVHEDGKKLAVVEEGVSLQQLVDGLNALGVGPRDLISILQAVKAAGAIQADVEVM